MSNIKYILGHFEDPDDLMHGIGKQWGDVPVMWLIREGEVMILFQ